MEPLQLRLWLTHRRLLVDRFVRSELLDGRQPLAAGCETFSPCGFYVRKFEIYEQPPSLPQVIANHLEEGRFVAFSDDFSEDDKYTVATLDFLGKAGARMNEWREKFSSPDFPFTTEQAEQFRDMKRPGSPFGSRGDEGHGQEGHGPHHGFGPDAPPRPERPDRDMAGVPPEVNEARKALKKAIKQAVLRGEDEQRRVADILRRAAEEIRGGEVDEVDLG